MLLFGNDILHHYNNNIILELFFCVLSGSGFIFGVLTGLHFVLYHLFTLVMNLREDAEKNIIFLCIEI